MNTKRISHIVARLQFGVVTLEEKAEAARIILMQDEQLRQLKDMLEGMTHSIDVAQRELEQTAKHYAKQETEYKIEVSVKNGTWAARCPAVPEAGVTYADTMDAAKAKMQLILTT